MPKLYSIIILCHNQLETTKLCFHALFKTDLTKAFIIAVDNASTDGTFKYLHDRVPVLGLRENIGVGSGYNRGFEVVDTPFFLTLNNDILIYEEDWLEKLHAPFVDNPKMAQVGVEGTPCWLDPVGMGHPLGEAEAYFGRTLQADYVQTSCMMASTEIIRANGPLFDPAYKFAYCEDSDLSLRLRSKGYEIAHVPLNTKHLEHTTLGDQETVGAKDYYVANHALLRQRWGKYLDSKSFD